MGLYIKTARQQREKVGSKRKASQMPRVEDAHTHTLPGRWMRNVRIRSFKRAEPPGTAAAAPAFYQAGDKAPTSSLACWDFPDLVRKGYCNIVA